MTEKIQKGDFIKINYTGKTKEEGIVFDTTIEKTAKEANLGVNKTWEPVIICVGEQHVLQGLDKQLENSSLGKHTFTIIAEEAFGKKSAKLLQLIPRKVFKQQDIQPTVGLEINVDNQVGIIRTVSGGRIIVDFNHPLASKDLEYDVEIIEKITDKKMMLESTLKVMRIPFKEITITEGNATVKTTTDLPEQFIKPLVENIKKTTKLKSVVFKKEEIKQPKKKDDK